MRYKKCILGIIFLGVVCGLLYVTGAYKQVIGFAKETHRTYTGYGGILPIRQPSLKSFGLEERVASIKEEEEKMRQQADREQQQNLFLESCLSGMTLEQKITQLLILTNPSDINEENLETYQPGGIIFFGADFQGKTMEDVKNRVSTLQSVMEYPLLIGVDEEGGEVTRISGMTDPVPVFESARKLGNKGDFEYVKEETKEKVKLLQSMGINVNFAPVADIVTDRSAYMYERSAGADAETVSAYVESVVQVMEEENMISSIKHFPGYGNNGNTHKSYVEDKRELYHYEENDFVPFVSGINAGADMVMVSHIVMQSVDSKKPASLSKKVHKLLREDLGFSGVIMADDLNMKAVLSRMTLDKASGAAIAAGNDMIFSADLKASLKGIKSAVKKGKITKEQLDASVKRVLRLKLEHRLINQEDFIDS